ncbi:L-threonylcarbamoyladenylate synthase [Massilia sp. W12]|uniref:L-threonylcarbamoyladenylate synthase n=1 Tax=Massilia sp. W12 TaxID=3126507 RepID=UPI0030D41B3C
MSSDLNAQEIAHAARLLEAGGLVAFPTETVYGLGADAENPQAVAKIYAAKGRPSGHPVIVHLAPQADPGYWVSQLPAQAEKLIAAFWPGPLTLILPRAPHIPDAVAGGQDTIGVRCPSHPVAQALLQEFKHGRGGVAAPSANKFGQVSPTASEHVRQEFTEADGGLHPLLDLILEGGQSEVGIESTILDLSRLDYLGPVLLRPGHISAEELALHLEHMPLPADEAAPRVSGALASHYAPRSPLALIDSASLPATLQALLQSGRRIALLHHSNHLDTALQESLCARIHLPPRPHGFAHGLYAALRRLDNAKPELILVEQAPDTHAWHGVNDRLRRAAHDSIGILSNLLRK